VKRGEDQFFRFQGNPGTQLEATDSKLGPAGIEYSRIIQLGMRLEW